MKTRGYSLEAPHQGASNEYPQHMFPWRNKKNISTFWMKKNAFSSYGPYGTVVLTLLFVTRKILQMKLNILEKKTQYCYR